MIKIYVSCHKEFDVPKNELLYPIQVGTSLNEKRFDGFLYDNTGVDHISFLNHSYCELTAQYWAWKNDNADYYGFFHYRRYLYPKVNATRPYLIEKEPSMQALNQLRYDHFAELIENYSLIAPLGENMHISVKNHYAKAPFHHLKDLELVAQIVKERHPDYTEAMNSYLCGSICYFGNIFIMKHSLFTDYCQWLFSILAEFDSRADTSHYNTQERRVNGYVAERLFGVYFEHHKKLGMRTLELPRVHFETDNRRRISLQIQSILAPPSTKRRSIFKNLIK